MYEKLLCYGFDRSGEVLAIGGGAHHYFRDVGTIPGSCGWAAHRVSDGELIAAHETKEPVTELPEEYRHGDVSQSGAKSHRRGDLSVRWGRRKDVIVSTHRRGKRVSELVVERWAEPPRVDDDGQRVWAFAHGRTTVFDVPSGEVLFFGRDVPRALRPPRRARSREVTVLSRHHRKLFQLGKRLTLHAITGSLAIYEGPRRTPFALARFPGKVAGLSRNERWLVAGGPRGYRVFDLERA